MTGAPTPPPYTPAYAAAPPSEPLYGAGPGVAYRRFWRRGVDFRGAASPSEFWWPFLINGLISGIGGFVLAAVIGIGLSLLVGASIGFANVSASTAGAVTGRWWFLIIVLYGLVVLLPNAAVLVRRLHDAGLPGLLALLWFVPFLGLLIVIVMAALPTKRALPAPPPII